jgi:hypothetical protein
VHTVATIGAWKSRYWHEPITGLDRNPTACRKISD